MLLSILRLSWYLFVSDWGAQRFLLSPSCSLVPKPRITLCLTDRQVKAEKERKAQVKMEKDKREREENARLKEERQSAKVGVKRNRRCC